MFLEKVTGKYIVNGNTNQRSLLTRVVPAIAGILFAALFMRLGFWQLDRADEKVALQEAFDNPGSYQQVDERSEPIYFTNLQVQGTYLPEQQILVDNIVRNGRLGYYVLSPVEFARGEALLLVNRGWIEKGTSAIPDLALDEESTFLRGRAGRLPRVGIRPGEAFEGSKEWPRVGVWPTYDEIATELERPVLTFLLLLDAEEPDGFARQWEPPQNSPSTHYGYAFQWFAMAAAIIAILGWQLRKQRNRTND